MTWDTPGAQVGKGMRLQHAQLELRIATTVLIWGKKDRREDIQQSIWLGPAADSAGSGITARFYYAERECHEQAWGINVRFACNVTWIFLRNMERLLTRRALGKAWKYQWRYGGVSMKLRRSISYKNPCMDHRSNPNLTHLHSFMCMWMQTERRIYRTITVLRPVAGSEPWSGSVLRFCVRVFAEDGRFKRVHAEEGLGKTRSYIRWVSVLATLMKFYHGNRSFRLNTSYYS